MNSETQTHTNATLAGLGKRIANLSVKQKVGFIAVIAQGLSIIAIGAGIVGMIFTNNSIRSMYADSIMPLEHLRELKYSLEYDVIQVAKNLKEGKMSSNAANDSQSVDNIYKTAYTQIEVAEKVIKKDWQKYSSSSELTTAEKQKLPKINESMQKALVSIADLKETVKKKDLPALIDYVESEMPFLLSNMTQPLDELMQIQVKRAHEMYGESQIKFDASLVITLLIYLIGAALVLFVVRLVIKDILTALEKLVKQSEALAANNLSEPFVWTRDDELGTLGESFENTRVELFLLISEINRNKEEVERAHENICSSINYARRIQLAFLPNEAHLKESVSDYSIVWRPKDVIGGDCYWIERFEDGCFVAAIDCTGHGVPGALMTFVVLSLLSRTISHENLYKDPAALLMRLNQLIKNELGQHDESSESNDGMDGAFVYIKGNTVTYAAANIPLIYHAKGAGEMEELRADKSSIGYVHSDPNFTFTNQTITLEKGGRLYLVTDGITDQIGGSKKLSHGKKRFKKVMMESMNMCMQEQTEFFMSKFYEYKGDEMQRDDNTLICIEI